MTIELINKNQRNFRNHSQGSRDIGLTTVLNMLKELKKTMDKNKRKIGKLLQNVLIFSTNRECQLVV